MNNQQVALAIQAQAIMAQIEGMKVANYEIIGMNLELEELKLMGTDKDKYDLTYDEKSFMEKAHMLDNIAYQIKQS